MPSSGILHLFIALCRKDWISWTSAGGFHFFVAFRQILAWACLTNLVKNLVLLTLKLSNNCEANGFEPVDVILGFSELQVSTKRQNTNNVSPCARSCGNSGPKLGK